MLTFLNQSTGENGDSQAIAPFQRLARTQAASVAGDTLLTVALANSLFFDVDPNGARWRIGLYLLLTIAPFAVVAPFLGPVMDRFKGGHRLMMVLAALVRAALMAALVFYVKNLVLFPLAFSMLVMSKTHAVAKSSLVPTAVPDSEDLVRCNSKLTVLGAIAGGIAGVIGVALLHFGGTEWVLGLGSVVFLVATVLAFAIPAVEFSKNSQDSDAEIEIQSSTVRLGAAAIAYLRGCVGFITMLLAFSLRGGIDPGPVGPGVELGHTVRESLGLERLVLSSGGAPPWHFGVALVGAGLGGLLGAVGVPAIRRWFSEEKIISISLVVLGLLGLFASLQRIEVVGAAVMGFAVALAGQVGKQAFDSLVQRDAPQHNLGRTFSRFESRFQLAWVLGALFPVVLVLPSRIGYLMVAGGSLLVMAMYLFGRAPVPSYFEGRRKEKLDRKVDESKSTEPTAEFDSGRRTLDESEKTLVMEKIESSKPTDNPRL